MRGYLSATIELQWKSFLVRMTGFNNNNIETIDLATSIGYIQFLDLPHRRLPHKPGILSLALAEDLGTAVVVLAKRHAIARL